MILQMPIIITYISMTFSQLINQKIGFGKYQIHTFLILCLIDLNDGVQLILSSFLNPIIKANFPGMNSSTFSLMASIFYVGILIGSILCGLLADQYGRKELIKYGSILQVIVSLSFYFADSVVILLIIRFFYGFSFGFTVAISTVMFSQVSTEKYKATGIILMNFCMSLGKIYGVLIGFLLIQSELIQTNWKLMMVLGSLPNLIVLYGSSFILFESPQFLFANKRYQEGILVLQKILQYNNCALKKLQESQREVIRYQFQVKQNKFNDLNHHSLLVFVSAETRKILSLVACWIVINFCYYGQLTIEALKLGGKKSSLNLSKYFYTVLGQIPSILVSIYLINHLWFGRKKSLMTFMLGAFLCFLIYSQTQITFFASFARFFMKDIYAVLYPLTTEIFQTSVRAKGFGFCSGSGRIGAILMPFILIPIFQWNYSAVYVVFSSLFLINTLIVYIFVQQTLKPQISEENEQRSEVLQILNKQQAKK